MPLFELAKEPPTPLGRYRILSPNCGLRVSPIVLGAMSIGDKWENYGMGTMNKESSFKLLDAYYEAGGNFIDTSSNYQDESSEEIIGEWAESRGIRDQLVIATKYSINFKRGAQDMKQKVNYVGNNVKSMHLAVEASLKKLRTDYIDILYLHYWDFSTSIEEIMNGLNALVLQGKVLYLGVSDTPAWVVSKANQYAKDHGKSPFVIYQGAWSCLERSFERDIIPMCRSEGLALAPWNALGQGKLRTDAEEQRRRETGEKGRVIFSGNTWERNEIETAMSRTLEKIANAVGAVNPSGPHKGEANVTAVALAYVMQKTAYVFPIVGGRKVEHLMSNIEALKISLSDEQIKQIESVVPFDPGWPTTMIGDGTIDNIFIRSTAIIDKQAFVKAIHPSNN